MAAFHVYVEGPVERTPDGIERLAVAISKKYGLPVPDLIKRMTAGRFRVKANVDAATADAYARALEEVGARVKVEDAHPTHPSTPVAPPEPATRTAPPAAEQPRTKAPTLPGEKPSRGGYYSVSPPPSAARSKTPSTGPMRAAHERSQLLPARGAAPSEPPPARDQLELAPPRQPATPPIDLPPPRPNPGSSAPATAARPLGSERPGSSSLPPATSPRPAASSLPPQSAQRAGASAFQSGLSAAYSQQIPVATDLGAIGDDVWSLSTLDGNDAIAGSEDSFGPPSPGMAASIGPAPEPPAATFAPKPMTPPVADTPLDLFRPPDAEEAEQQVDLAVESASAPRTRGNKPTTPPLSPTPAMRKAPVSQGVSMGGTAAGEMPRARLAAGIFLAILLGFLPAHLIASMREGSAFKKIDDQINAAQSAADTPEMYAALDPFRDAQLARKESERRSIALQSLLIWAVFAAGLGYVWFRVIPWDRTSGA